MADRWITAANAVLTLWQPILFPTPQQIQGFGTDDVYSSQPVKTAETQMGVDGFMSAGFVFNEVPQTYTLKADSASNDFFETVNLQQIAAEDIYPLSGLIILPAIGRRFQHVRGVLSTWTPLPDAKKLLQDRKYEVTWQRITPVPA